MTNTQTGMEKVQSILAKAKTSGTMSGLKDADISSVLASYKSQIAASIPKHLTPERMIQMSATLIARNPKIAQCSAKSLVGAVMQASVLGLPPIDSLGYCYFVPYNDEVQFQIGYRGYIALARRSGELAKIYAEAVYANDEFQYERGLEPKLIHKPCMQGSRGEFRCVYAVYHLKSGFSDFVVLSKDDVESYRRRSPAQKGDPTGAWKTDYAAMAKKTAIRRIAPYLPMQVDDLDRAVAVDDRVVNLDDFAMDNSGEAFVSAEVIDTDTGEVMQTPIKAEKPKKDKVLEEIQKLSPGREVQVKYASSAPVGEDMGELPNIIE